jgi:hypothetical protein
MTLLVELIRTKFLLSNVFQEIHNNDCFYLHVLSKQQFKDIMTNYRISPNKSLGVN